MILRGEKGTFFVFLQFRIAIRAKKAGYLLANGDHNVVGVDAASCGGSALTGVIMLFILLGSGVSARLTGFASNLGTRFSGCPRNVLPNRIASSVQQLSECSKIVRTC